MKKIMIGAMFSAIVVAIAFIYYSFKNSPQSEYAVAKENEEIYCLNTSRDVFYISGKDYSILNKTRVNGAWSMTPARNGKIYIAIRGSLSKAGKEVAVLQYGKIIKNIELEFPLPRVIKYNQYNDKIYVGHIRFLGQNYISTIDTTNDQVVNCMPYNYEIEDITFAKENIMIVSSWDADYNDRIDIIDLDNNSIIDTIPIYFKASSIKVIDNAIYALNDLSSEPSLYVIDWKREPRMIEKVELADNNPWRIYTNEINGKSFLYITHYNVDDMSGESISLIDPSKNVLTKRLENIHHPRDIAFNGNDILVGDQINNRLLIVNNDKIIHEIDVGRTISVVKSKY
ncbi:MAG: hypothetical protein JL50_21665 [Peptococcaceae bacterium BICA1-7]|nr:MAG: hypothetical protein JL50_21665 [Peptococcaceae bacterium BICA1-7]HBV99346.1 hypothetical protein [Desulfotomaculum sp.]